MKYINATKIHKETGVGYELIRKLTRQNYLQPVNSEPPYMYTEDAIQMVLDYKYSVDGSVSLKHLDKRDEEILFTLKDILNRLESIEQKLNTPQMPPPMFYSPQYMGRQKVYDPDKERHDEKEKEMEELRKWPTPNTGMFNELNYYFSFAKYEKLLALHEELTGDMELREKFDALGEELKAMVPEYKRLREEGEKIQNLVEWTNYINGVVKPAENKWGILVCNELGVKKPTSKKIQFINFQTPFEIELGENLPF